MIRKFAIAVLLMPAIINGCTPSAEARPRWPNKYRTESWGTSFPYGGYSTYLSSYVLWRHFPGLIAAANNPSYSLPQLRRMIGAYKAKYQAMTQTDVEAALAFGRAHRSLTVYDEQMSAISTDIQNAAFLRGMSAHPELAPVDNMIRDGGFTSRNFQFNAHRTLYNNAFQIPQNSMAGIINAYAAGIRSIELDVLETKDGVPVAIHDLVTNRLDGTFDEPPTLVEKKQYDQIFRTKFDILDPIGDKPSTQSTRVNGLMTIARVLYVVSATMSELTLYLDARNNSPVSLIHFLYEYPQYRNKIVIKIYPFAFPGGLSGVVSAYAKQYGLSIDTAREQIVKADPNVLLVMGSAAAQSSEAVGVSTYSDLSFSTWIKASDQFPFSRHSQVSKNSFQGKRIFSDTELARIEGLSWQMTRWGIDFSALTNVMIYQMPISVPSLVDVIDTSNVEEFSRMPINDRVAAAINDNFTAFYKAVMTDKVDIKIFGPFQSGYLRNLIAYVRFGFSDRFPDFALAKRANGAVDQSTLSSFLYNMNGTVYTKCDYGTTRSHSAKVAIDKMAEMSRLGTPAAYATTDLATDLRAGAMGMLGDVLPKDLSYRANGVIKARLTPRDIPGYRPPIWTTRLYGKLYAKADYFAGDLTELNQLGTRSRSLEGALASLSNAVNHPDIPIINPVAMQFLGIATPALSQELASGQLEVARAALETQKKQVDVAYSNRTNSFFLNYNITYNGERIPPDFTIVPAVTPVDPTVCATW